MARYTPRQQRAQKLMRDFVRYCATRKRLVRQRARLIAKPIHITPISNLNSEADSTSTTTSSCTIFSSLDSESTSQASDSSSSYLSSRLSSADYGTSYPDADSEYESDDSSVSSFDSEEESDEEHAPRPQAQFARRVQRTVQNIFARRYDAPRNLHLLQPPAQLPHILAVTKSSILTHVRLC
ncbi:hypothetical protein M405DRAFT_936659 [Rhizopogon salebrosus TDB-379]|nr:hypothetical protein M405DRAFT_936659 [Rhizopogon salebrosus TDB-379]